MFESMETVEWKTGNVPSGTPLDEWYRGKILMPSSGFGPSIWNGGYTPLTPWERWDVDPWFDSWKDRRHDLMPKERQSPPQSPGGNNGPGMMAALAGANPNYGIGDPGGSFVGIGAMTRACNVPNALQPTIPGGGLLGPDGYVPIWSNPGYDITPPVVSGALGGGFNPTMPPIMPFYPPSIDDLTRDPNGDRSLENAPGYDPFSFTGSAVGSLIGVTGYGSGGYSSSSTTGSQGSSGSGWHLGQGNHGHTITSPEGYTLTTLRAGMDYGFEDSGQDRGTGLLAVDDYTGYDGDKPMIEIGPNANKGYEVTHQRTGLYAHTEVGSAISSDVELEEHFDRQIREAKKEATIIAVRFGLDVLWTIFGPGVLKFAQAKILGPLFMRLRILRWHTGRVATTGTNQFISRLKMAGWRERHWHIYPHNWFNPFDWKFRKKFSVISHTSYGKYDILNQFILRIPWLSPANNPVLQRDQDLE